MSLRNATALVTGGAQGFGKAFARVVLEMGGKVSLLDILPDLGLDTQNEFNTEFGSGSSLFIKCDVRKKTEMEAAFRKTRDTFGGLDLVVNNAGVGTYYGDWEKTIDVNLTAVMRGCLLAADSMGKDKGGKGGHIINIASTAGLTAIPFDPAYAASKHGVVGLSRSLALTFAAVGIRVNCLCPSFANTALLREGLAMKADENLSNFKAMSGLVGLMSIDEVVVAFKKLLEDETATGAVLTVTPKGTAYVHKRPKL